MPFSSVRQLALCLAAAIAFAHPSFADDEFVTPFDPNALWPAPIDVSSSFMGLGIDIKGVDMAVTTQDAHAASGGDMLTNTWRFNDFKRVSNEKIFRDDVSGLRISLQRVRGFEDRLQIESSRWHTGNQIVRMARFVTINDVNRQPLTETFVDAILEKYGPPGDEPFYESRLAGLSGVGFTGRLWTWDAGKQGVDCAVYELPNALRDVYRNRLERLEDIVADVDTTEACDAAMVVYHNETAAGTVSRYYIEITDIRLLFLDALNDRRIHDHMQTFLEKSLQTGNTNSPDL